MSLKQHAIYVMCFFSLINKNPKDGPLRREHSQEEDKPAHQYLTGDLNTYICNTCTLVNCQVAVELQDYRLHLSFLSNKQF